MKLANMKGKYALCNMHYLRGIFVYFDENNYF